MGYYIGCTGKYSEELFHSRQKPTKEKYRQQYNFVTGPYKDARAAMKKHVSLTGNILRV